MVIGEIPSGIPLCLGLIPTLVLLIFTIGYRKIKITELGADLYLSLGNGWSVSGFFSTYISDIQQNQEVLKNSNVLTGPHNNVEHICAIHFIGVEVLSNFVDNLLTAQRQSPSKIMIIKFSKWAS